MRRSKSRSQRKVHSNPDLPQKKKKRRRRKIPNKKPNIPFKRIRKRKKEKPKDSRRNNKDQRGSE